MRNVLGLTMAVLAGVGFAAFHSQAQEPSSGPSNTGMADPVALINAFDRFMMTSGGGARFSIHLVTLRGLTAEDLNAGGAVSIDFSTGSILSEVRGLPSGAFFELWLLDNRSGTSDSTFADPQDLLVKVAAYTEQPQPSVYNLAVTKGPQAFAGFFPDRAFVVRSGQSPSGSFLLTGSSTIFDRLAQRQLGFDPTSAGTRTTHFANLTARGRQVFLKETFAGNGRTCATCHVESNNFTIDPNFIASLPQTDPLFIAETSPVLQTLENPDLMRKFGLIGVNADGFGRPMVFRSTQNVQALANSSARVDPTLITDFTGNGLNPEPPERLGWGNDGAPLRDFALVAIAQHGPKTLSRVRGLDFRAPSDEELDALAAYQLAIGRQEDFDLQVLELKTAVAMTGKTLFLDSGDVRQPGHKNCNACHFNGGGTGAFTTNPEKLGFPHLGQTPHGGNIAAALNVHLLPLAIPLGLPRDGGFGVLFLPIGSFGNFGTPPGRPTFPIEEFSTPPVVEAADTRPFFHNHMADELEDAVAFYGSPAFRSPLSIGVAATPITISSDPNDAEVQAIAAFLRVLNALENIRSAINVAERGRQMSSIEDARDLARLALSEVVDAMQVLSGGAFSQSVEPGILAARARLQEAQALLEGAVRSTASEGVRNTLTQAAAGLRAARLALANPATLPGSFRN
jgi:cytochrome c peroxidase